MKYLFLFCSYLSWILVSCFLHVHLSMWLCMLPTAELRVISISCVFGCNVTALFATGILYIYG